MSLDEVKSMLIKGGLWVIGFFLLFGGLFTTMTAPMVGGAMTIIGMILLAGVKFG